MAAEDVAALVSRALGVPVDTVELIPTQEFNRVYRVEAGGRRIICKFDSRWRVVREPWAYRRARDAGVAVPEVLFGDADAAEPFMIVSEAPGVELYEHPASFDEKVPTYQELGRMLRRLHSVVARGCGSLVETALVEGRVEGKVASEADAMRADFGALEYLVEHSFLTPEEGARVRAQIEAGSALFETGASVLLHADLGTDHVWVDPSSLAITAIIDFGDVRVGDPVWDFVCLDLHEPSVVEHVVEGYDPSPEMRATLREKMDVCALIRLVGEARWMDERDLDIAGTVARVRAIIGG